MVGLGMDSVLQAEKPCCLHVQLFSRHTPTVKPRPGVAPGHYTRRTTRNQTVKKTQKGEKQKRKGHEPHHVSSARNMPHTSQGPLPARAVPGQVSYPPGGTGGHSSGGRNHHIIRSWKTKNTTKKGANASEYALLLPAILSRQRASAPVCHALGCAATTALGSRALREATLGALPKSA